MLRVDRDRVGIRVGFQGVGRLAALVLNLATFALRGLRPGYVVLSMTGGAPRWQRRGDRFDSGHSSAS